MFRTAGKDFHSCDFCFFENHIVQNGWFELKIGRSDLHVFSFVTQLGGTDTSHYFSFFSKDFC